MMSTFIVESRLQHVRLLLDEEYLIIERDQEEIAMFRLHEIWDVVKKYLAKSTLETLERRKREAIAAIKELIMNNKKEVWILLWKYSDDSNFGIVNVYNTEVLLQYDLKLLNGHGDPAKNFYLDKKEIIGA